MIHRSIIYFGQQAFIACDEKCNKAWGLVSRPRNILNDDADDYELLADDELGEAPEDPETYEGGIGKPIGNEPKLNKWCTRECERCAIDSTLSGALTKIPDYSKRIKNRRKNYEKESSNRTEVI